MRVTKNDRLAQTLLSEMMDEINENREGQHPSITDLIDCLTKTFYNTYSPVEHSEKTKLYFLIGLGLERSLLIKRKGQPTYGETEGIHWHVDSVDEGLLELKSTRKNPKQGEEGWSERWLKQIKGYLRAIGENEADLAVVYLIQPEFHVWRITFDKLELDIHWNWLQQRRAVWETAKATNIPPKAFTYNESWECEGCQYKVLCDIKSRRGE